MRFVIDWSAHSEVVFSGEKEAQYRSSNQDPKRYAMPQENFRAESGTTYIINHWQPQTPIPDPTTSYQPRQP